MANDFGQAPANYTPDVISYSGMIGKLAKQIIEGTGIRSKFDTFDKDEIKYGKDVEVTLYEEATGEAFDPATCPVNIPNPVGHTLLFKTLTEQRYSVRISDWEIDKSALDGNYAAEIAAKIVDTLYNGDRKFKNAQVYSLLNTAAAGAPTSAGTTQIVSGGSLPEITDEASARNLLLSIKTFAAGLRDDPAAHNPYGLSVIPNKVVLVIPYQTKAKLDVFLFSGTQNLDYVNYGVDEIITVPAAETEGAIYILDDRYLQLRVRKYKYAEQPCPGGDSVNAFLLTSRMYAACPLFGAVKITQST